VRISRIPNAQLEQDCGLVVPAILSKQALGEMVVYPYSSSSICINRVPTIGRCHAAANP
jgi:hypothetical protein